MQFFTINEKQSKKVFTFKIKKNETKKIIAQNQNAKHDEFIVINVSKKILAKSKKIIIIDSFAQSISKFTINKQNIQIARSLIKKNKIIQKKLSSHVTINIFYFFVFRNNF